MSIMESKMVGNSYNSSDTLNYALNTGCTVPLILGLIANTLVLYTLLNVRMCSRLTAWLLRLQVILDGLCCMWNILFLWIREFPYTDRISGWIQCHVWRTQTPYWVTVSLSTINLTWITFDRLWATVYVTTYERRQISYIIWTTFGSLVYGTVIGVPTLMLVEFVNMTCETTITPELRIAYQVVLIHQPFWVLIYYLLPIVTMLAVHFRVVCYTRGSVSPHRSDDSYSGDPYQLPFSTSTEPPIDPLHKAISVGVLSMILCVILGHTYDTVIYLMSNVADYSYSVGSDVQLISAFVTTLNSIINPAIIGFWVPSVRKLVLVRAELAARKCKQCCTRKNSS